MEMDCLFCTGGRGGRSCENGTCSDIGISTHLEFANSDWCDRLHMHRLWRVNLRFKDFSDPMSLALG